MLPDHRQYNLVQRTLEGKHHAHYARPWFCNFVWRQTERELTNQKPMPIPTVERRDPLFKSYALRGFQLFNSIKWSLDLGLWSSYPYDFSSFHKLTTLTIHNSFTLSLPAQNLPLSQILPTICPLSFSWTDTMDSGCSPFLADRTIGRAYVTVCRLSVCLSVTFCIVAKWYVLAKKCLKEWIGNQCQKVHFLGRRHISTSGFAATAP